MERSSEVTGPPWSRAQLLATRALAFGLGIFFLVVTATAAQDPRATRQHALTKVLLAAGLAAVLASLAWLARGSRSPLRTIGPRGFLLAAVGLLALSRAAWIAAVPTEPISDFEWYHDLAQRFARGEPLSLGFHCGRLAAWGYPFALGAVYALLSPSVMIGELAGLLCGAASAVVFYRFVAEAVGELPARLATLLFVLWPAQLMLSSVLASEHLALLALLLTWLLLARSFSASRHALALTASAGVCLGVSFVVRSATLTASAAAAATILLFRPPTTRSVPRIALLLLPMALVDVGFLGLLDRVYGESPSSALAYSLMVGANQSSLGGWNEADGSSFCRNASFEEANRFAMQRARERIVQDPRAYLWLAWVKGRKLWQDGSYGAGFSTLALRASARADRVMRWSSALFVVSQGLHLLVLLLATVGLLRTAGARGTSPVCFLLLASLAATTLAHMVLECQPRYQFVTYPALLVFAALALAPRGDAESRAWSRGLEPGSTEW